MATNSEARSDIADADLAGILSCTDSLDCVKLVGIAGPSLQCTRLHLLEKKIDLMEMREKEEIRRWRFVER
jgi:copper(I)-binding protein